VAGLRQEADILYKAVLVSCTCHSLDSERTVVPCDKSALLDGDTGNHAAVVHLGDSMRIGVFESLALRFPY